MRTINLYASLAAGFIAAASVTGCRTAPKPSGGQELPRVSLLEHYMNLSDAQKDLPTFTDDLDYISHYMRVNQMAFYPDPKGSLRELKAVLDNGLAHANNYKSIPLPEKTRESTEHYAGQVMSLSIGVYQALQRVREQYDEKTMLRFGNLARGVMATARGQIAPAERKKEDTITIFLGAYDVMARAIDNNPNPIKLNRQLGDVLPEGQRSGDNITNLRVLAKLQARPQTPDLSKVFNRPLKGALEHLASKSADLHTKSGFYGSQSFENAVRNAQSAYMEMLQQGNASANEKKATLQTLEYARSALAQHSSSPNALRIMRAVVGGYTLIARMPYDRDTTPFKAPPTLEDFINKSKGNVKTNAPANNAPPAFVVPDPRKKTEPQPVPSKP